MVLKLSMEDDRKRAKALKAAVGLAGVVSAALDGEKLTVVGDGVDSVELTMVLRKKMGYAELLTVGSAEEKKEEGKKGGDGVISLQQFQQMEWPPATYYVPAGGGGAVVGQTPYYVYGDMREPSYDESSCSIMPCLRGLCVIFHVDGPDEEAWIQLQHAPPIIVKRIDARARLPRVPEWPINICEAPVGSSVDQRRNCAGEGARAAPSVGGAIMVADDKVQPIKESAGDLPSVPSLGVQEAPLSERGNVAPLTSSSGPSTSPGDSSGGQRGPGSVSSSAQYFARNVCSHLDKIEARLASKGQVAVLEQKSAILEQKSAILEGKMEEVLSSSEAGIVRGGEDDR
ncbi:hypothetical protein AXF42_Ash008921 [Apostasia shenzhenica]|uniref:HMA domain-containing protein n=1 Tax=Apostasia shenzhenica TaxID=1088818 RepID=A0A2I0ASV9_9ASPA|nr:hypothetical protein AXF42_Ash008921 [Apostasia shenzhenica]